MSSKIDKSLTYSGHKLQGRTKLYGMDISIENKKGSYRTGVDSDGHKWKTYMNYDYGYIRGTVGTDGDHLDCYIGPSKESSKVYVIHQNNPVTHKYDEDKCMLCFESADAAKKAYLKQYDRPGFFGSMESMTVEEFKQRIFSNKGKKVVKKSAASTSYQLEIMKSNAKKKNEPHAEGFYYESQKNLTQKWLKYYDELAKTFYRFVCNLVGLPESNVITKANVIYKGEILYTPETGMPLSKSDLDILVKKLTKFLNVHKKAGEKIVTESQVLGRLLEKYYQANKKGIRKTPLDELKQGNTKFDTLTEYPTSKIADIFDFNKETEKRIELYQQSAAQRITSIDDRLKNDIAQVLIDGAKNHKSKNEVSQELLEKFGSANRDWKKIADTEIQNNMNNAYISQEVQTAGSEENVYFQRMEVIDERTCNFCREMNGTVAVYSKTPLTSDKVNDKYATVAIWDGKDWNGQKDFCAMGVFHPNCRGVWIRWDQNTLM